jgi:acyl carrier protein
MSQNDSQCNGVGVLWRGVVSLVAGLLDVWVPFGLSSLSASGKACCSTGPPQGTAAVAAQPQVRTDVVLPRTRVEKDLVEIWVQVLGMEQVSVHDDFFDLGGDSMLSTQLVSRLRETFAVELLLRDLFTAPTVAELAVEITQRQAEETDSKEIERLLAEPEGLSQDEEHR